MHTDVLYPAGPSQDFVLNALQKKSFLSVQQPFSALNLVLNTSKTKVMWLGKKNAPLPTGVFYFIWLNIRNKQCACSAASQQLHHTSHPTDSHSERHTEASRVNALLKDMLTDLPAGQKNMNPWMASDHIVEFLMSYSLLKNNWVQIRCEVLSSLNIICIQIL